MESMEDKWQFVYSGSATLAGRYLRHFWQPIYESDRLAPGQAVPIQILNERFTLYRDEIGKPHVVDFRCPHRGTQLSVGWVEGENIRCFFHGWKFNSSGQCIEQPAEPKPFCDKIKIRAYPTEEQLGLVFVYCGEQEPPPIPRWPEFEDAVSSIVTIPCNYFQSAENILDDAHVGFAHRSIPELKNSPRGRTPPKVLAEETSFGLSVVFHNDESDEKNLFIMPNIAYLSYDLVFPGPFNKQQRFRVRTLFWYVPVDDTNHNHVQVTSGPPVIMDAMRLEKSTPHNVSQEILAVLAGSSSIHKEVLVHGKRSPNLLRIQDGVTMAGQGAIADRSLDHLGASDAGVSLLRRVWLRELRALANEIPLKPFVRPETLE